MSVPAEVPDAPPRRDSRRGEILDAFTRAVAERGYDGTNFGDLAAELGISKGTIVHHFGAKDRMVTGQTISYAQRRHDGVGRPLMSATMAGRLPNRTRAG